MKKLLLLITLSFLSISSFATCKMEITNNLAADHMGHYELMDSFHDRGYYKESYTNSKVDYSIKFRMEIPYVCSQSRTSILDSFGKTPNRMKMIVTSSSGKVVEYDTGMRFYHLSKRAEKRAIKRLIKKLPKCSDK
jgi:hypothetical protein